MSGTLLRAKLSGVRALSTVLLALALASPAGAQVFGVPTSNSGPSLWLSVGDGSTRGVSVSDKASDAIWHLDKAAPRRVAIEWGREERTIGVAASMVSVPLRLVGSACGSCNGTVKATQVMGTYRMEAPLFGGVLRSVTELGAGVTRWSGLTGRDGDTIGAIAANDDFTYSVSFGLGVPLGSHLDLTALYDVSQVRHERQSSSLAHSSGSSNVGLTTLRFGARVRLGK